LALPAENPIIKSIPVESAKTPDFAINAGTALGASMISRPFVVGFAR
jgi:hypothetical protein